MRIGPYLIRTVLSRGRENQSFIGASWAVSLLKISPRRFKRRLALLLLSWSPHYFFRDIKKEYDGLPQNKFLESEFTRNKESRARIAKLILATHLNPDHTVLDYGCGPGFLAGAVSPYVAKVLGVDVSKGVLECARILNNAGNIIYLHTTQLGQLQPGSVDLVYSFAVIQHVTDQVFDEILAASHRALNDNNGRIILHVVVDQQGWRNENEWITDKSIKGRVKLKYGLNCFNRSSESVVRMLEKHGFSSVCLQPIDRLCDEDFDDICKQHLVSAVKSTYPSDSPVEGTG
jgi:SAM-dependent methyltransferase